MIGGQKRVAHPTNLNVMMMPEIFDHSEIIRQPQNQ